MSSMGTTLEITPLLPWRPAKSCRPAAACAFTATKTLTIFITPGGRSSPRRTFFDLVLEPVLERALLRLVLGVERLHGLRFGSRPRGRAATTGRAHSDPSSSSSMTDFGFMPFGPLIGDLAGDHVLQARVDVALENRQLVVTVAPETRDLLRARSASARSSFSTPWR